MTQAINLVFPHQLFHSGPLLENAHDVYLVEERLFFSQYRFHKQKLAFHRASMKAYQDFLEKSGRTVRYIESSSELADIRKFRKEIDREGIDAIHCIDPVDDWLEKRLRKMAASVELTFYESPAFLNTREELSDFFNPKKESFFQTAFYKQERKKRKILVDGNMEPEGGEWTYDSENRKKYPKGKTPPSVQFPDVSPFWEEALAYTKKHFAVNPGKLTQAPIYPINRPQAEAWLDGFFLHRFHEFGDYEDAIVKNESLLHHSLLSPLINVGLLLPGLVLEKCLDFAQSEKVPLNSVEGFVRQLMGWREFVRGMYWCKGGYSRTKNFWGFKRKIPASFYDGTTGILPVDGTIKKVLSTGYCHHIERLMIVGNFMLLCEFDPDEVYRWFMELFIDAYDWVMVPNVYGMSQFADGGLFATKPYIGGSNYLRKMGDYPKGEWEAVWDGLFWSFVARHSDFFQSNPRLSMMYHTWNRMGEDKKESHLRKADKFLEGFS